MKATNTIFALASFALLSPLAMADDVLREPTPVAPAAATTVQTMQLGGTISQFGENTFALRTDTSIAPVQYHYTTTTQWVDDAGNIVTRESVQTGVPVTIHYAKTPEGLVVSKVVVRKGPGPTVVAAPAPPATTVKETVTTTTTGTVPVQLTGTVSSFGESYFTIRSPEGTASPAQYIFSDTTKWMDENGAIVPREVVRMGVPVTIYYTKSDQGFITSKVIVRRGAPPTAAVEKVQTEVIETPSPRVVERKTLVTPVEKRKAVVVKEKVEPKRKIVEVEKPVVVEKPEVVEKKTTVTTTTPVPKKKKKLFDDDDDDDDDDDKD